ncbi:MAG: sugar phosphate isomerase/epimerase [Anaerolineaceae bacterium]|nr:sugar phosphate isomerase/epimerase [Anaerolineaceae bacterium]
MNLSIVYTTQLTKFQAATFSGDLDANLAKIAGYGYNGVELAIRDPQLVEMDELEKILRKYKLKVPAIGTGQAWGEEGLSFTDPDPAIRKAAINRIQSHIPIAEKLNAVIIIGLVRGILKPGVSHPQAMDWLREALRQCTSVAKDHNVRLALEPINRYETSLINNVKQGLDLVSQVGADNFGLLLDTFHMNIEEPQIEESIRLCADRIFHFHVADSNRWYPGGGHLDFGSIFTSLFNTGYNGFISGEFLPFPDVDTAAQKSIAHLQKEMK